MKGPSVAIALKTAEQIERIREAGRIVRRVLDGLGKIVAVGVTTEELDAEAERLCHELGGQCLAHTQEAGPVAFERPGSAAPPPRSPTPPRTPWTRIGD